MPVDVLSGLVQGFRQGAMDMEEINSRREDRRMKQLEWDAKAKSEEEQKKRQKFSDSLSIRSHGFKAPQLQDGQSVYDTDPGTYAVDHEFLKARADANEDPMAKAIKQLTLSKAEAEAEQLRKGTKLPPDKVLSVQQGAQIPKQLTNISQTLEANKDIFGPVVGRAISLNPKHTRGNTIKAQLKIAAQSFGRYMEGGVLRKEDESKYEQMFPQLSDDPDIAANKLSLVQNMLAEKQNADVSALGTQGYDTSGFSQLEVPATPGILTEGLLKDKSLLQAGPGIGANVQALTTGSPKSDKVKMSNGKETLMVDPGDIADAEKDGFKRVK